MVPAHRRPRRTQRAVDSVAAQTYRPLELVVVDDGSSPPLEEGLSLPEDSLRRCVLVRHEVNRGANVARNTGLEAARGEYLALLDSDDEWLPAKVGRQVEGLAESSAAEVSYTGFRLVDEQGRLNSVRRATATGDILEEVLRLRAVPNNSVAMVSRTAIDAVGLPNPKLPGWQDWEWYLRLAARFEFSAVRKPLAIRYSGQDRISRSHAPKREAAYPMMREKISDLARTPRQARIGQAYLDFRLGYSAVVNAHYSDARRQLLAAIRRHPWDPKFYLYLLASGRHYTWLRTAKRAVVRFLS